MSMLSFLPPVARCEYPQTLFSACLFLSREARYFPSFLLIKMVAAFFPKPESAHNVDPYLSPSPLLLSFLCYGLKGHLALFHHFDELAWRIGCFSLFLFPLWRMDAGTFSAR